MTDLVYNYFRDKYGLVNENSNKTQKLLRATIPDKEEKWDYQNTDHDLEFGKHFWNYAKKFLEDPRKIVPTLDVNICTMYFRKIFKCQGRLRFLILLYP